jgi:hypothetical protein
MSYRHLIVRVLVVLALVSGVACQQSPGQAAAPQTPPQTPSLPQAPYDHVLTDTARVLAGMLPEDPSRFATVTSQASWQAFHKEMDASWIDDTEKRTRLVSEWRDRELGPLVSGCRNLMYPFAGPDILNVYQFFPTCESYVLFGLEQLGTVPQLDKLTPADADRLVTNLREALSDLFTRHYFITKSMESELSTSYVNGTLPVVLLMLARLDAHIVSVERVTLAENGIAVSNLAVTTPATTPSPAGAPGAPAAPSPVKAFRVTFVPSGSDRQQTAIYFRAQAENAGLKKVVAAYLRHLAPATTMLKSASYLLHDEQFSAIRSVILESSTSILQDDSGMPYRFLNKPEWRVKLYGKYAKPVSDFNYGFQPDLDAAYAKANPPALPFSYGYHWRDGSFGVMLATRVGPDTGAGRH